MTSILQDGPFLTVPAAAARMGIAKSTADNWRSLNVGPAWIKRRRRVLYALSDIDAYLAAGRIETSESL